MPPFAEMTRESQRLEGEFRSHHHRLIAHSEEIAFYGGADREKEIVNDSYRSIIRLSNRQFTLQGLMSVLDTYLVKYGASMVAYTMMIPAGF
jgi:ATP-binding cassette subfamily D (ALD) protein 3